MISTPRSFCASIMSCPRVHSEVAEPCQVSPPSRSSDAPRSARSFFTRVARCAKPPIFPYFLAACEIDVRFAEPHRQQLSVAIGEVQQRYVPERRQVVESFVLRTRSQRKTGRRRGGEGLQELATRQRHLLTGDSGSSRSATRCVICSSVSTPLWPKRGMLEQAENASEL